MNRYGLPGDENRDPVDYFECDFQTSLVNKKLREFYRDKKFCDVTLIAGIDGTRVEAHRLVLAASSDYFCAMFGGSLSEAHSREVSIDQIDGVALKAIVDFMYFATIEIRLDNVENILTATSLLNLEKVAERGSKFMISHLEPSNCLGITLFAEQYSYQPLFKHAYAKVCEVFTELPEEEEFQLLSVEPLSSFLSRDDLCVDCEEDVFRVATKWIDHDRENREQYTAQLFELIRFNKTPSTFIESEVIPRCTTSDCLSVVAKAREKHSRNRNPKKKLTFINVFVTVKCSIEMEVYNPVLNCWNYQEWQLEKYSDRSVFKVAVLGNELVFAGGRTDFVFPSNIVGALDMKTFKWRDLPPMLKARHMFAFVSLNGKLYAIGGRGDDGVLQSVERYDPDTEKWKFVAPMLEKHSEHGAVGISGKIYVLGGANSFECYDPEMNTWTRKAQRTEFTSPAAMAVVNNCLFVITSDDRKLQRYDIANDMWSDISTLNGNIKCIECCGFGDSLVISTGDVYAMSYNTLTEEWSRLPPYEKIRGKGILIAI